MGIVSGKGGVGKTVVTANIGMALHEIGHDVTLVDADLTSSNLGLHLGLYSFHPCNIQKILKGEIRPEKAIYIHPSGLKLMPSSLAYESIDVDASKLKSIFDRMKGLVLVDSPPGIASEGLSVLKCCDDIIVVTNPEFPAVTDAIRVIEVAKEHNKNILGLVVNKTSRDKCDLNVSDIEAATELSVIAVIPEDKHIKRSIFSKMPVIHHRPYSSSAIEFRRLAARLVGAPYEPPKFAKLKNILPAGRGGGYNVHKVHNTNILLPENNVFANMSEMISHPVMNRGEMFVHGTTGPLNYQNGSEGNVDDFNTEAQSSITEAEERVELSSGLKQKRGPGRPKKKRGPGRPRKTKNVIKRGPGRPKKKRGPGRPRKK